MQRLEGFGTNHQYCSHTSTIIIVQVQGTIQLLLFTADDGNSQNWGR